MTDINCNLENNFIFFGCWNESYCNPDKPTLSGSSQIINYLLKKNTNPLFYIIAGDNYYPKKDKERNYKEFSDVNFNSGFKCLELLQNKCSSLTNIYMLMGNHDLQYETGLIDRYSKKTLDKCHVLSQELKYKDKFHFNKHHIEFNNSLILFTISTLYTDSLGKGSAAQSDCINQLKHTFSDLPWNYKTIEEIIDIEEEHLFKIITNYKKEGKHFKNIIICGHDPIVTRRNKPKENSIKIIIETINPRGIQFLDKLYSVFNDSNKFYLCADIHQFQKCIVQINNHSIQQYVVGTGGTTCDEDCVPLDESIITNDEWKDIKLAGPDTLLKYFKIEYCERSHGYLVCQENKDGLFIPYFQKTGECIDNWKVVKDQRKFEDEIMKSSSARTTQFSKRGGYLSNSNNKNKKTRKKYKKYKKYNKY